MLWCVFFGFMIIVFIIVCCNWSEEYDKCNPKPEKQWKYTKNYWNEDRPYDYLGAMYIQQGLHNARMEGMMMKKMQDDRMDASNRMSFINSIHHADQMASLNQQTWNEISSDLSGIGSSISSIGSDLIHFFD